MGESEKERARESPRQIERERDPSGNDIRTLREEQCGISRETSVGPWEFTAWNHAPMTALLSIFTSCLNGERMSHISGDMGMMAYALYSLFGG